MSIYNLSDGGPPLPEEPEKPSGIHSVGSSRPMRWDLDDDGQPLIRAWNATRRTNRNMDELIGVIRGIVFDGKVVREEVEALGKWLNAYSGDVREWPVGIIVERLMRIYEDGKVDDEELDDLKTLLEEIVGGQGRPQVSCTLPLTKPAPEVIFDQNTFVFTGKFAYGKRVFCQSETAVLGGQCEDGVTLRTDYLVIGALCSQDWVHTVWGRKIERAIDLQRSKSIYIISEERWCSFLKGGR